MYAASHAPSVGFSQPWEFVIIRDHARKQAIKENYKQANTREEQLFARQEHPQYHALKLEGIHEAPLNIAVFYTPSQDPVLGQTAMPEMGPYSVICAVQNMWLMARALNIGLGWVSILDPTRVKTILNAPTGHQLVAYLCLGYVDFFYTSPELEQKRWQKRKDFSSLVVEESYQ